MVEEYLGYIAKSTDAAVGLSLGVINVRMCSLIDFSKSKQEGTLLAQAQLRQMLKDLVLKWLELLEDE